MVFAFSLVHTGRKDFLNTAVTNGIKQAAPILIITGMGGALGTIIQTIPLKSYAESISTLENLGILIPFLIAALLKTAQGSSTVAIITTSSLIFPLLPLLGLDSEMGKIWAIMALGVGSMTVSHANDSYFWIVTQMSGMDIKTAYKTHTLGTLIQGSVGLLVVWISYWVWSVI
jgi:GntP family gluconate:H+ symporter